MITGRHTSLYGEGISKFWCHDQEVPFLGCQPTFALDDEASVAGPAAGMPVMV